MTEILQFELFMTQILKFCVFMTKTLHLHVEYTSLKTCTYHNRNVLQFNDSFIKIIFRSHIFSSC